MLSFWSVLMAELVGDKSLYALASLAVRFRWIAVFAAFTVANAAKMMAATLLGSTVMRFQGHWTYLISAVAFFVSAALIWIDEPSEPAEINTARAGWWKGLLVCFGSFFLSEWGDPGQIAAVALVLKSGLLLATWTGATLALMLKGAAVLTLGMQIRSWLPQGKLRLLASVSCCLLGILALSESLLA
jgi:putative Ca2+/H+ antiporter (TMEM165/GDT1 family)